MNTTIKEFTNKVYLVANSQIFPIRKSISKLGRKLENDLVIQDSMISRFHAEIHLEDEKFYLIDKNSTGGTYVNNERIEKVQINSGDTIILASTPLLFMIESTELKINSTITTGILQPKDKVTGDEETKPFVK